MINNARQLTFEELDAEGKNIKVKVYEDGEMFIATIEDGWWVSYGRSTKQAVKKVIERRDRELKYFMR